ncbi:hypothetical protein DJ564_01195 [Pseudomonas sp. 31-12]|nr:hypothetical protein DJ564_01195 [Pseudomonas sp. 31-12]
MGEPVGSAQNGKREAYGWSCSEAAGSRGHQITIVVVKWAVRAIKHWHWPTGLLPAVGAILIGEAFSQLSLVKALTGWATGRRTGAGS